MTPVKSVSAPRVAFIIPHFNHSTDIGRQLRAATSQQGEDVEVIVIDDRSDPEERAALCNIAAGLPNVRLILSEKNEGPIGAGHQGLEATAAPFVCFAAADDEVSNDIASTGLQALLSNPEAAFCFGDRRSAAPGKEPIVFPLHLNAGYHSARDMVRFMRRSYFVISTGSCLYRRQLVVESDGHRAELGHFSDTFLNLVLAFRHGAVFVDRPLGTVYTSDETYSSQMRRNAAAQKTILESMLSLLESRQYKDVAKLFRYAGVMPEHSLRAVYWLLTTSAGRAYLTPRLLLTCLVYEFWSACRNVLPVRWRSRVRQWGARGLRKGGV